MVVVAWWWRWQPVTCTASAVGPLVRHTVELAVPVEGSEVVRRMRGGELGATPSVRATRRTAGPS